jgi:uncharacterized Ntn-hydrolase superfamily protein
MNYRSLQYLLTGILLMPVSILAQDTFSICAVDSVTGEVGSAGATCITSASTSAIIISDVHPGVGVIHTQASYQVGNQYYARSLMDSGLTPASIIDSLIANDIANTPAIRQYGIVDRVNGVHAAAYTGASCSNYKNHITGPNYSIQGNILLGQQILDSMESRFLNTSGDLACKLMAALQGAKVIGADTRCNPYNISSFSAFIRVALPGDTTGTFHLDISVNTYPSNRDPIDSLQILFNNWGGCNLASIQDRDVLPLVKVYPNPVSDYLNISVNKQVDQTELMDLSGLIVRVISFPNSDEISLNLSEFQNGIYILKCQLIDGNIVRRKVFLNKN